MISRNKVKIIVLSVLSRTSRQRLIVVLLGYKLYRVQKTKPQKNPGSRQQ